MSTEFQAKLEVLNFIYSSREVLFGKFSDRLTNEEKMSKWEEVATKAKEVQVIRQHHDGRYVKNTTWHNWRRRAMAKRDKRNKTGEAGGKFSGLDECDELVFQIIGHDSPVLDGINVPESSGSSSSSVGPLAPESSHDESREETEDEAELETKKRKRPGPKERQEKTDFLQELKAQRIQEQLELCKREKHMKDLNIFKMEQELGMQPSEFTKHLYSQQRGNIIILDSNGNEMN